MSGTNTADAGTERQRQRVERKSAKARKAGRAPEPPKQRRPALAALALLLIVGGALAAGLLAVQMDTRDTVLVARQDIQPGTQIGADDLATAQVATDSVPTIDADLADQVIGSYATTTIRASSLVQEQSLSADAPVTGDRAIVSVVLNPSLTPSGLAGGDLVQVVRVSGEAGNGGEVTELSEALVLEVESTTGDELGGQGTTSASLLVPAEVAGEVIDASSADLAGLALLERGQSTGIDLEVATP